MSDEELFKWNFIDGIDELERDDAIADFKKMYYGMKEEFSVAELDKFATDDTTFDDPFDIEFPEDISAEEEKAQPEIEAGARVPEIPNFTGSVELGDEPESIVNVTRSSSTCGDCSDKKIDINVQCDDTDESVMDALKELICSLGLEGEFELDSECAAQECPEEPAAEPVAEPAVEPEEVKDLSKEDEVKVEMPEEVADEVKDGDMLVVKVDNKEKPELPEDEEEKDMSDDEFLEELGKELQKSRTCEEAWNAHEKFVNPGIEDERPELEADNAVKKCKPYKLVAHCEEENIDCEMKKPALEKPLCESIDNMFDLFEDADMPDDVMPEEDVETTRPEEPEVPEEPVEEKPNEDKVISDLIKDEVEAIDGYKDAKEVLTDPEDLETIEHIESEEVEHIDELADLIGKDPEVTELAEGMNDKDSKEFFDLCDEIGIKTVGDLDNFKKEFPGDLLTNLRNYRKDLGPDFKLPKEERGRYVDSNPDKDFIVEDFPEPSEGISEKELEEAMGISEESK